MSAGKGDKPRPVKKPKYDKNYESISWKKNDDKKPKKIKGKLRYSY